MVRGDVGEFFAGFVDHGLGVVEADEGGGVFEEAPKKLKKSACRATDIDDAGVGLVVIFGPMHSTSDDFAVHRDRARDHIVENADDFFVEGEGFGPRATLEQFVFFGIEIELGGRFRIHRSLGLRVSGDASNCATQRLGSIKVLVSVYGAMRFLFVGRASVSGWRLACDEEGCRL